LNDFRIKFELERKILGDETLNVLLHFSTTYLCNAGYSAPTVTGEYKALEPPAKRTKQNKLRGFSPQANHTDRATAAGRRS
jgi:hypothetical protein